MDRKSSQLNILRTLFVTTIGLILISAWSLVHIKQDTALAQLVSSEPQEDLTLLPIADTYIAAGEPDRKRPDLRVMWVGFNESQNLGEQHSLLAFGLAALPEASEIVSAELSMHLSSTTDGDAPLPVSVNRISGDWAEEVSWQEFADAVSTGSIEIQGESAQREIGTEFEEVRWDVTALLGAWQQESQASSSRLSLLLRSNVTSTERERAFWSSECDENDCGTGAGKRPQLHIQFDAPAATATPQPTASPTATTAPPQPTEAARPDPNQGEEADPSAALALSVSYQLDGATAQSQLPAEWPVDTNLEVKITLAQASGDSSLNGVNVRGHIPFGSSFVGANGNSTVDADNRVVEWTGVTVPADGDHSLVMTLKKPQPIAGPRIVITRTGVSSIVLLDVATDAGSDLQVEWNFGDGSPIDKRPSQIFQTTLVNHRFPGPGTYQVVAGLYNDSCRFLIAEEIVVEEDGGVTASNNNQATTTPGEVEAAGYNPNSRPDTDGTARLPWCPEIASPAAPQIAVTWTNESGEAQSRVENPSHQLFLPMHD